MAAITQSTPLSIGLVVLLISAIVTTTVSIATSSTLLRAHCQDGNVHLSQSDRAALTELAVDMRHVRAELADVKMTLRAMEKNKRTEK